MEPDAPPTGTADLLAGGKSDRLSLGQVSRHLNAKAPLEDLNPDVIGALRNPSVEGFQRALQLLESNATARFAGVEAVAVEQSAVVGEADLRRLKRAFSSLKNTFLQFDVKAEFLAALGEGMPNGTEEAELAGLEDTLAAVVAQLRAAKAHNAEQQAEANALIAEIVAALEGLAAQRADIAADIAALAAEAAAAEAADADAGAPLPDGPGATADECRAAAAAAAAEARRLEAALAAAAAEAAELDAAAAAEDEENALLAAQAADLEARRAEVAAAAAAAAAAPADAAAAGTPRPARFAGAAAWADEAAALLAGLGGVAVASRRGAALTLRLSAAYPLAAVAGGAVGACSAAEHELALTLRPGPGGGAEADLGAARVAAAALSPPDVAVADLAARGAGVAAVVREARARLGGWLHRRALAEEAAIAMPGAEAVDGAKTLLRVPLGAAGGPPGAVATLRVVRSWPEADDDEVEVAALEARPGAAPLGEAARARAMGMTFRGRSLVQAARAVAAEVAAAAAAAAP